MQGRTDETPRHYIRKALVRLAMIATLAVPRFQRMRGAGDVRSCDSRAGCSSRMSLTTAGPFVKTNELLASHSAIIKSRFLCFSFFSHLPSTTLSTLAHIHQSCVRPAGFKTPFSSPFHLRPPQKPHPSCWLQDSFHLTQRDTTMDGR